MPSTLFIMCLVVGGILMLAHPVFLIPFIVIAALLAANVDMRMDSNTSIIIGITGSILLLSFIVALL
ncbi:hypothetical protein PMPD1_2447 [Paramixta manurensis]|uniref:Uncharacterized protein n=1 Tax=Paramixta manurensis TaxID=2740817 RepID=A0A6M8UCD2_9GAMM|nr:hypothetical protein PMPD1_2447 [Erwiniaceae bacterium PD-1]